VNVAIYWLVDGLLVRPLPYRNSDELVDISTEKSQFDLKGVPVSYTKFEQIHQHSQTLESVGAYFPLRLALHLNGMAEEVSAARATASLFQVFEISPAIGRMFLPQEEQEGGAEVAVVSDAFWRTHMGAKTDAIGQSIDLDGKNVEVVGVLPANFRFPFQQPAPAIWVPRVFDNTQIPAVRIHSGASFLGVYGRIRQGESISRVQVELSALAGAYERDNPGFADAPGFTLHVVPLKESLIGTVRSTLLMLLVAAGCLWLVGSMNIAGLLVARATTRKKEIAIRQAVGAAPVMIAYQLVAESSILASLAGLLGVALASAFAFSVRFLSVGSIPGSDGLKFTSAIVLAAIVLSTVTAITLGLLPAAHVYRRDIHSALKEGGRASSSGGTRTALRRVLVTFQVAAAVVLSVSAGVLTKSFSNLTKVDLGLRPIHVMTFTIGLPEARYRTPDLQREYYRHLQEALVSTPGLDSAGVTNALPIGGAVSAVYFCPDGVVCLGVGRDPVVAFRQVSPGYIKAMQIDLRAGRDFDIHDIESSRPVAIINETIAKHFFPHQDPIGKHVALSRNKIPLEIVGIANDVRFNGPSAPVTNEMYVPVAQFPARTMSLVVRSALPASALTATVRKVVSGIDGEVPLADVLSMEDVIAGSILQEKISSRMTVAFALIALLLASLGIYGVITIWVTERSQEIGLRMAMGATARDIVTMLVQQGMRFVLLGLVLGIGGSVGLNHLLTNVLFGIRANDPTTLIEVAAVFSAVAMLALIVPARRALAVDPIVVMR
jgi:putative ABC transport system permease protein